MAAGNGIYQLRLNKFVDRRIFVDVLHRIGKVFDISDYVYLGMGGVTLEDHSLMYTELNLRKLISFDQEPIIVERQKFNKPNEAVRCICRSSSDCVASLDNLMDEMEIDYAASKIIWLDYTSPRDLYAQLGEVKSLAGQLGHGDVLKVTLNANPAALDYTKDYDDELDKAPRPVDHAKRLNALSMRLGEYLYEGADNDSVTKLGLPKTLALALRSAIGQSIAANPNITFFPLVLLRYADGQQMLTMCGVFLRREEKAQFEEVSDILNYPFYSTEWDTVHEIQVPDITIRERLLIDQIDVDNVNLENIALTLSDNPEVTLETIRSYKKMERYFPRFHYVRL